MTCIYQRFNFFVVLFFLCLVAALILFFVTKHPSPTGQFVQLAWFYHPPDGTQMEVVRNKFNTFIFTKNDERERDLLREKGIKKPILQYLSLDVIIDPGSCTAQPWRNQVADRPGDYCYISEHHPEWFLLDEDGNRMFHKINDEMRSVMMDPGHPGWREFWLSRARESQEILGWEGVFLDNVEASLGKRQRRNALPAAYPTDRSYQAAIEGFLAYIYTDYFQPEGRPLYANIIDLYEDEVWFRYLRYLDGGMEEGWVVGWFDDPPKERDFWQEELQRAEKSQAQGKEVILVAQGKQDDYERQTFAYASYLLVSNGNASFRYTNAHHYHELWLYDNYDLDLGTPLGPRYQEGEIWRRDFTNGIVRLHFDSYSATIVTSSTKDSGGNNE